jgi:hypothetical protein
MNELKNVKDVLKDVLRFVKSLKLKPEKVLAQVFFFPGGAVQLRVCIGDPSYINALVNYYSVLQRKIKRWANNIHFIVNVKCYGSDPVDYDDNFFYFLPKQSQVLKFKDRKLYRHCEVKGGGFYRIELFDLD